MVHIEEFSIDELLALPKGELDAFVFTGRPVVARVGSAEILIECKRRGEVLVVDLAHIDGGGEGALPTVVGFVERFAKNRDSHTIESKPETEACLGPKGFRGA